MTDIVREYSVSTFRGKPEDVPIAEGVDMDALRLTDADPLFVSLPIVPEIGKVSKNGLLYDEELVTSIAEQINSNRPGGIFGHLKDEERSTSFPLPAGMWVGAVRVGQALWAKAYIPPGAGRDYVRNLKAIGGSIATSIYGSGNYEAVSKGVRRLRDFSLESLDFAPPGRAALGYGAVPYVTAEMDSDQEIDMDKAQVIAELVVGDIPAPLRDAIVAEASKVSKDKETIAELTTQTQAQETVIETLKAQLAEQRQAQFDAALDAKVAELTAWKVEGDDAKRKIDAFRAMLKGQILSSMGEERKSDRVAEVAQAAWGALEPIAETIRDALAGPAAIVNGKVREMSGRPEIVDTPEARQLARAQLGI